MTQTRNAVWRALLAICLMTAVPALAAGAPGLQASLAEIVAPLSPAVVTIASTQKLSEPVAGSRPMPQPQPSPGTPAPEGPYSELFDDFLNRRSEGERRPESLGSGFVVDAAGLIVTNAHVIESADKIVVMFSDGARLPARLVGRDAKTDIALLRVEPRTPLTAVRFGNSDDVRIGDWVMAIGNPFGLGGSLSVGVISAVKRDINSGPFDDYLQTDAAINRGNSGGPLFDMKGHVVGMNTAILAPMGVSIGVGFSVSANTITRVVEQLKRYGETRRGWIGVRLQSIGDEIAESLGLPEPKGVLVADVTAGSPAAAAGVQVGDVILRYGPQDITRMRALPRLVADSEVGARVTVQTLRDGAARVVEVVVGRMEEEGPPAAATTPATTQPPKDWAGLQLSRLTDQLRRKHKIGGRLKGVVVTAVEAGSLAASREITTGDVIVEITHRRVETPEALYARLAELRKLERRQALLLVANARGELAFITLPVER